MRQRVQGLGRCYALGDLFKLLTPDSGRARVPPPPIITDCALLCFPQLRLFRLQWPPRLFHRLSHGLVKNAIRNLPRPLYRKKFLPAFNTSLPPPSSSSCFVLFQQLLSQACCLRVIFLEEWEWRKREEKMGEKGSVEREFVTTLLPRHWL